MLRLCSIPMSNILIFKKYQSFLAEDLFLNINKKANFLEYFFDAQSIINVTTQTAENKKSYISFLVGNVKGEYTILSGQQLRENKCSPDLPKEFVPIVLVNKIFGLKNDQEGRYFFARIILGSDELLGKYKATLLERTLTVKNQNKNKVSKI